ncbi:hypothetical protein BHE74_00046987 [Ensete ventricosum]|nr:hypothetical protein BHE74_00046987 [Ensete ventricosum]
MEIDGKIFLPCSRVWWLFWWFCRSRATDKGRYRSTMMGNTIRHEAMEQGGKVLLYTRRISPDHAAIELEGEGEVRGGVESGKGKLVEGTDGNRDSTRFNKERQSSRVRGQGCWQWVRGKKAASHR